MLRLPRFQLLQPKSLEAALALLAEHGERAMIVAGGTDLVPNMKHRLFEPDVLVSLARIEALRGVREEEDGTLVVGAMTPVAEVAADERLRARTPALAQAASLIAGPQLRTVGTLGGNVMLDTRCQWYNQTHFWRKALGYCLKKDGTVCHVVQSGQKCVAAASNDTAPALMSLGARLVFADASRSREVAIDDLWKGDGIYNKNVAQGEILVEVRVPPPSAGHRGAYGKLRERGSIDFPLFGLAVRLDLSPDARVEDADLVAVALAARPLRIRHAARALLGTRPGSADFEEATEAVAALAAKQCHPLPNVPGDHEWRQAMVPVYVRRTLLAAGEGTGPVHHV